MAVKPKSPRGRAAAAKAAAESGAPEAAAEGAAPKADALRLKALLERVGAKSSVAKKDVRGVVEATLTELGAALASGEGLNLPGLGHLRVSRKGEKGSVTLKMRPADADAPKKKGKKAAEGGAEALADAAEAE